MAPLAGFNVRARVNDVLFSVAEWSVNPTSEGLNITNSEGKTGGALGVPSPLIPGSFQSRTGGPSVARIMLKNASFDPDENPFAAPLSLFPQDFVDIKIYPNGLADTPHEFPSVQITGLSHEGNMMGLQPVTLEGESDGSFTLAT